MSAAEETLHAKGVVRPNSDPIVNRIIDFLSSVRVGVVTLCTLVVLAMIGMLIMQQNVQGFDTYYPSLTPAEKVVFGHLGFFDIYHSWYFEGLLLFLSLNIILASIDHFMPSWSYVVSPKLTATKEWLLARREHIIIDSSITDEQELAERVKKQLDKRGLRSKITQASYTYYDIDEEGNRNFSEVKTATNLFVFGERGKWNRLGAYIVHVALLTLFLGHFVALRTGFDADVQVAPGETTDQIQLIEFNLDKKERYNVKLPFTIDCTDIQQRLIDPNGSIGVTNTMDWRTQVKIDDPEFGVTTADISLNKPLSYRGYRFFQAQATSMGSARTVTLDLTPQNGGDTIKVEVPRNGVTALADGTQVQFADFQPDFAFGPDGQPSSRSTDYNNPVAILNVTTPAGERTRVFAFAAKVAENIPVGAPKAGYKWRLADFEKSPLAHILSIKYDPFNGALIAWYFGGFGLIAALAFVFFVSHKRIWAMIGRRDDGRLEIVLAGEANRNHLGFEDKFRKIADDLKASVT
jgi:cytochrome c biogenesis protein